MQQLLDPLRPPPPEPRLGWKFWVAAALFIAACAVAAAGAPLVGLAALPIAIASIGSSKAQGRAWELFAVSIIACAAIANGVRVTRDNDSTAAYRAHRQALGCSSADLYQRSGGKRWIGRDKPTPETVARCSPSERGDPDMPWNPPDPDEFAEALEAQRP